MNQELFDQIRDNALKLKYNSFEYIEYDECQNTEVICDDEKLISLQDSSKVPTRLHFATDDFEMLIKRILDIGGEIQINFVPHEYKKQLEDIGFSTWAEYIDHFNMNLKETDIHNQEYSKIEFLKPEQCEQLAALSKRCANQSRGFTGETSDWFLEWLEQNDVIVIYRDGEIAGFCCVAIYDGKSKVWVREVAVDPKYQGQGYGKMLMRQAICYGTTKGAEKGFLAADVLNKGAIKLYNQYGFIATTTQGELQMIKK